MGNGLFYGEGAKDRLPLKKGTLGYYWGRTNTWLGHLIGKLGSKEGGVKNDATGTTVYPDNKIHKFFYNLGFLDSGGIAIGDTFITEAPEQKISQDLLKEESMHALQSRDLGPAYLPSHLILHSVAYVRNFPAQVAKGRKPAFLKPSKGLLAGIGFAFTNADSHTHNVLEQGPHYKEPPSAY